MSIALYRLGRACYRHKWTVLLATLALLAVLGALAVTVGTGTQNSFSVPGTESQRTLDSVRETFPEIAGGTATIVAVAPPGHRLTEPSLKDVVERFVEDVKDQDGVKGSVSPFDEMMHGTVTADGRAVLITVQFEKASSQVTAAEKEAILSAGSRLGKELGPGATVSTGGDIFLAVPSLSLLEALGLAMALVILLAMLRSATASAMPLLASVLGVGISGSVITAMTAVIVVSSASPLLAVMIGLAVGIDYSLFILSRHIDQLRDGRDAEESAAQATATAGSAVVFAGMTVGIALLGLSVVGIPFLSIMGVTAAIAVAIAVAVSLTTTPALLGLAGERLRPKPRTAGAGAPSFRDRVFRGWVRGVTRHPIVTLVVTVAALAVLALPALGLHLGLPNNGTDPEGSVSRQTYEQVSKYFGVGFNGPLLVTADIISSTDPVNDVKDMAREIERVDGVALVSMRTPNRTADTGVIVVIPETGPSDPRTEGVVTRIREMKTHFRNKYGFDVGITGYTALGIDISASLGKALLPFGVLVVGLSFLLLTVVFRSIAIPLKASLGYVLSLAASFGIVGAIFGKGLLADQLHVTGVGSVISFMPIMVMGVLFGLAMDYEVFLVSRMREAYVHGASALEAIETGFVSSAPVVSAAAAIMFCVFAVFVPHGDFSMKPIALGLAVGVFIDAFVVRMVLVPAVLALLGDRAWALPPWLDALLPRLDVEGEGVHRVLDLADWPTADSSLVLATEGLVVSGGHVRIDASLEPGGVLVIEGPQEAGKTELLLALTGRARIDEGKVKLLGYVLPDEAEAVRTRVPLICCEHDEVLVQLEEALAIDPSVIGIDDVDALRGIDRGPFLERLEDVARRRASEGRPLTLVITTSMHSAVPDGLGPSSILRLDTESRPRPEEATWALA